MKSELKKVLLNELNEWDLSCCEEYTLKNDLAKSLENVVKKLMLYGVGSSNDLIIVELSDEEIKIITSQELDKWEKDAMEFDGFEGWIVRGRLVK